MYVNLSNIFFCYILFVSFLPMSSSLSCLPTDKDVRTEINQILIIECSILTMNRDDTRVNWKLPDNMKNIGSLSHVEDYHHSDDMWNITSMATLITINEAPVFPVKGKLEFVVTFDGTEKSEAAFRIIFGNNNNLYIIIGVCVSVVIIGLLVVGIVCQRRRKKRDGTPGAGEVIGGHDNTYYGAWQEVDLRDDDLRAGVVSWPVQEETFVREEDNEDLGTLNIAFDSAIDNLTSLSNENFTDRPISRYIAQISSQPAVEDDPEFVDAERLPSVGMARVAVGGGADLGAGQVHVRDHEILEIIQKDLGSGYTAIRKVSTGEYGFLPTTSLNFDERNY